MSAAMSNAGHSEPQPQPAGGSRDDDAPAAPGVDVTTGRTIPAVGDDLIGNQADLANRAGLPLVSRRGALRIFALGGAAAAAWSLGWWRRAGLPRATRAATLMGTSVHLTLVGDDPAACAAAADATLAHMRALESLLTRHRADSEVGRLNATGRITRPSAALRDCLTLAREISELGDGAFDITVQPVLDVYRAALRAHRQPDAGEIAAVLPLVDQRALRFDESAAWFTRPGMRITLDGIGKGYIIDRGVAALRARGFANVFVEAGGDLSAAGQREAGAPWRIGIRPPRAGGALQARFEARNQAVATSGDYMQPFTPDYRQHHIIDPRTGRSSPELASSTVVAPDAATADALATLTMVLGPARSRALLEQRPDCEGYFVSKRLGVIQTSRFGHVAAC